MNTEPIFENSTATHDYTPNLEPFSIQSTDLKPSNLTFNQESLKKDLQLITIGALLITSSLNFESTNIFTINETSTAISQVSNSNHLNMNDEDIDVMQVYVKLEPTKKINIKGTIKSIKKGKLTSIPEELDFDDI